MQHEKRLFLLDAYALIYRAYYALIRAPRVTSYGLNTSAIFGFCNTLDDVLRKEDPTHLAVCFDPVGGSTFRHEMYADYKAGRDKQPEDITASIPIIKRILAAYRIPVVEIEGYEADDVIGTLSRVAEKEGFTTYMMTPDKDYGQLVTDHTLMYRPSLRGEGFEIRGPRQVEERHGIERPEQVIDLLALEGDASDNIPGCPGVGEKTAAKLIAEFGSVENLLANTDKLKGALQRRVVENAEQIRFSKQLATIKTDVPLGDVTPDSLRRSTPDYGELRKVYTELEFKTFLKKLDQQQNLPDPAAAPPGSLFDLDTPQAQAAAMVDRVTSGATYEVVTEPAHVTAVVAECLQRQAVGVALYGLGDAAMTMRVVAVALAPEPAKAVYIPLEVPESADVYLALRPLFATDHVTLVCHTVKAAMLGLRRYGVEWKAPWYDTSVAHYLLEPEMKHNIGPLAARYLNYAASADIDLLDANARQKAPLPEPVAADLLCEVADIALRLRPALDAELESQGLKRLLDDIELPVVAVLADMEWTGVRIDPHELHELSRQFAARQRDLERRAYELAGTEFNASSPMQVGEILFERLKIGPKAKRTKTGAYSTTEEILEKYAAQHPLPGLILQIRALKKLLATYVNALPELINPRDGKLHTTYNQTVTSTGRISSTNPNLQNIPVRTDDGREIRRAFIADPGHLMLSADYSQIELRLIADISGDPDMIAAFRDGGDFHAATAAKIFHVAPSDVTPDMRRAAKTANFGIIYGISAFGLSERLGIPRAEAKELIEGYYRSFPGVRKYMDEQIALARERGYVETITGRRRMLPDINSRSAVVRGYAERNAINAPIQGSAADIIKRAMIGVHAQMQARGMASRMIMQVHDELVFDVVPDELEPLRRLVTDEMEHAYSGAVPLEVSAGVGSNWLEAH